MMYQACCKTAIRMNSTPEKIGPDGATACPICGTNLKRVRFTSQLQIGDIVRFDSTMDHGYADATVYNVTETSIRLFRPYIVTTDFTTSGGAIPYIGTEDFSVTRGESSTMILLRRSPVEK